MSKFYTIELGPEHLSPFLKIYLKDTAKNSQVKLALEDIQAVDHVNMTQKVGKKADLTVYPNKAYEIKEARDEIETFLDHYFNENNTVLPSPTVTSPLASGSSPAPGPQSVFISYSWDDKAHQDWVLMLADKLQSEGGVKVMLDQYELRAGKSVTHFMERSISADKVIMIMTPNYKLKADARTGGVGFEYSMITERIYHQINSGKIIPIARKGTYDECSPIFIKSLLSLNMTDDAKFSENFMQLLRIVHDEPEIVPPAIGPKPVFPTRQRETPVPAVAAIGSPPSPASQSDQPASPIINQHATATHGNTYQAGRDLHVHEAARSAVRKTNWLTKTRIVISIITGIIGISITLFFTLPEKFKKSAEKPLTDLTRNNPSILVTGIVKEMRSDRVIPYCNITSNLNSRDTLQTTSAGTFQFQVTGSAGQSIHIFAWAKGYKPWNEIHTLGSPIEIQLDPQ
jgi:hypothetical protein